jgi:hypothetical protein
MRKSHDLAGNFEGAKAMTWREILKELRSQPTVSVPTAGHALAGLSPKAAYAVAQRGALGVPVLSVGGKKRVPFHGRSEEARPR